MLFFRINCSTKIDRHEMIDMAKKIISDNGGWITDFKMYSNISICLNLSFPIERLKSFIISIRTLEGLEISNSSNLELENFLQHKDLSNLKTEEDIIGTLQITFEHNEKDLRIEIPKVPG